MSKSLKKTVQRIIETTAEKMEENNKGLIRLIVQDKLKEERGEEPAEITSVLWTMLVNNIHDVLVFQAVSTAGQKLLKSEYDARFIMAKNIAEDRVKAVMNETRRLESQTHHIKRTNPGA